MHRRRVLRLGLSGTVLTAAVAGCTGEPSTGSDSPSSTPSLSPTSTPSPTPPGTTVNVVSQADQPDAPVEYEAGMAEPRAADDRPARLRITLGNPTGSTVVVGEERDVQFFHRTSADDALYLYPAADHVGDTPVEPGCWRLTDYVAVPEYYGTVEVPAGESIHAASFVFGHPDLPEDVCLPEGEHRVSTSGKVGVDADAVLEGDATGFDWGFTLRISGSDSSHD